MWLPAENSTLRRFASSILLFQRKPFPMNAIGAPDWTATGADGRVSTRNDVLRRVFESKVSLK